MGPLRATRPRRRAPIVAAVRPPLASSVDTFMTTMLVVVLVLGYVLIWGIWHFGFRGRADEQAHEPVAEPLNRSGQSVGEELRDYEAWLRRQPGVPGSWQRIAVVEQDESRGGAGTWQPGQEVHATEFGPRFTVILSEAQRDWVTLRAVAIEAGCLIVAVQWCSQPPSPDGVRRVRLPVEVRYDGFDAADR